MDSAAFACWTGGFLWERISFCREGQTEELAIKFITQKLSDFSPTLGFVKKCMWWDFPEPRPNLVLLENKFIY